MGAPMSPMMPDHGHFMHRCLELARMARSEGNTPVGSVVVLDGDYARLHSLHIVGVERRAHESVQSILARSDAEPNS